MPAGRLDGRPDGDGDIWNPARGNDQDDLREQEGGRLALYHGCMGLVACCRGSRAGAADPALRPDGNGFGSFPR